MKIKFLSVVFMSLIMSSAFAGNVINVGVKGMVCSFCAQGIEKKFSKLPEVEEVKVDLNTKVVTLKTKDDLNLPDSKIKELIIEAGYNVTTIERK
ncbi:MAG: heavy-metal-associated domain-containing protein [Bacteriovoracaceae bacterium]|nr:heavy-metal-associated domain-containing protein [Bacteriovoracaceae bacterium]